MTRKEAVRELEFLVSCSYVDEFEPTEKEALKMAIKELKQKPKIGHWIKIFLTDTSDIDGQCSECGFIHKFIDGHTAQYNYCPNCGCHMVEPHGSED